MTLFISMLLGEQSLSFSFLILGTLNTTIKDNQAWLSCKSDSWKVFNKIQKDLRSKTLPLRRHQLGVHMARARKKVSVFHYTSARVYVQSTNQDKEYQSFHLLPNCRESNRNGVIFQPVYIFSKSQPEWQFRKKINQTPVLKLNNFRSWHIFI